MNLVCSSLVFVLYAALSVCGLSLIKEAAGPLNLRFWAGGVLYGAGFMIWILLIIRSFPLSVAFPLSAGALILGTQFAGWLFLKETLSAAHLGGVGAILFGIFLIYRSMDGV